MIKDRNCKDLIEETKKRWQEYTEKGKESEVAHLCLTICDPMDCNLPGSSAHGIFQAGILVWVAISFSRASSRPRDRTYVSCIAGEFFTAEPPEMPIYFYVIYYIYVSYLCVYVFMSVYVRVFYMKVMLKTVCLTTSEYTCYGLRVDLAWSTMVRKTMGLKVLRKEKANCKQENPEVGV